MRIGQTSIVVFCSRLVGSVLGFVATIYFARLLGAEVLGYFALTIALVSWLKLAGDLGIASAVTKRVSEGTEREKFVGAGIIAVTVFGLIVSILVLGFRAAVDEYIGRSVAEFVVLLLALGLVDSLVKSILNGQHSVHLSGLLEPVKITVRTLFQLAFVYLGMELTGLYLGQAIGLLVSLLLGTTLVRVGISFPDGKQLRRLFDYAKYAWFGNLRSRSYNDVDIVILGLFVPSSLVGVYSVAWGISKFLTTFDGAISQAIFPEISTASAADREEAIAPVVTDALRFGGLILIPGFVGGLLLGERILRLYGPEFERGSTVLALLILAVLLAGYQKQLTTSLNAVDRPDLAFRINLIFVGFNAVANVILIYRLGWIGAAIATVLSAFIGFVLTAIVLQREVSFGFPTGEILRQVAAAALMGVVVFGGLRIEEAYRVVGHNLATILLLVGVGASVYFGILFGISSDFRITVTRNLPIELPLVRSGR